MPVPARLRETGEHAGSRTARLAWFARFSVSSAAGIRAAAVLCALSLNLVGAAARADPPVFRHPFDGQPIDVPEAKTKTPALEQFKQTGVNAYREEPAAIADGKALYEQWCQVCHNADGSGKMCPALIGSEHVYPQTSNDPGMFAILYAGASGAMQSFANRISQDDMLKIIAYVRALGR